MIGVWYADQTSTCLVCGLGTVLISRHLVLAIWVRLGLSKKEHFLYGYEEHGILTELLCRWPFPFWAAWLPGSSFGDVCNWSCIPGTRSEWQKTVSSGKSIMPTVYEQDMRVAEGWIYLGTFVHLSVHTFSRGWGVPFCCAMQNLDNWKSQTLALMKLKLYDTGVCTLTLYGLKCLTVFIVDLGGSG